MGWGMGSQRGRRWSFVLRKRDAKEQDLDGGMASELLGLVSDFLTVAQPKGSVVVQQQIGYLSSWGFSVKVHMMQQAQC